MKQVKKTSDVPQGPHFCVLVYDDRTIHHEGDERSRTHPGHGYPAYDEVISSVEHWVSVDEAETLAFVKRLEMPDVYGRRSKPYVVLKVEQKLAVLTQIRLGETKSGY